MRANRRNTAPPRHAGDACYAATWRIVDGAVADAIGMHRDWIAPGVSPRKVRSSITKRVVGHLLSLPDGQGAGGNHAG